MSTKEVRRVHSRAIESFIWVINDFSRLEKLQEKAKSPIFSSSGCFKWQLLCYPEGQNTDGYVSLFLEPVSVPTVTAGVELSVYSKGKQKLYTQKFEALAFKDEKSYGFSKFVTKSVLLKDKYNLLPSDRLSIYCTVTCDFPSDYFEDSLVKCNPFRELSRDFENLFSCIDTSDVDIVVGCKTFHCHKMILSARCPVFGAMFGTPMQENISNKVNISDIDANIFEELLNFIYTGRSPKLSDVAEGLYIAADKYGMCVLTKMCEDHLIEELKTTQGPYLHTLIFADKYNAKRLKSCALKFLLNEIEDEVDSEPFREMSLAHPHLLLEILKLYIEQPLSVKKRTNNSVNST